jgi:hypothetical protein
LFSFCCNRNGRDAYWPPSAKTRDWTLENEIDLDNLTAAHCDSAPNLVDGPTKDFTHGDWMAAYCKKQLLLFSTFVMN